MTSLMHLPWLRRTTTLAGIAVAIAIGFMAIRAAAAWTAAAASLDEAQVSPASLTAQLAAEQSRSAVLLDQLRTVSARSDELSAALVAAEDRITADADIASALTADLADAKKRLKTLEASIRRAKAALASSSTRAAVAVVGSTSGEHEDEDDEQDDD